MVSVPDTGFYGTVTEDMIRALAINLKVAHDSVSGLDFSSPYPVQLCLPFGQDGMIRSSDKPAP
jgi:hypothetical protein